MTNNQKYGQTDKRLILQRSLIGVSLILLLGVLVWYLFKNNEPKTDLESEVKANENNSADIKSNLNDIAVLDGYYNGIRESMDGSIEAVMLQISVIDKTDNSFKYIMNIGTNKRFTGIGSFDISRNILKADMIGDINYSINTKGKILLTTSDSTSNTKYELIKE